MTIKFTGLHGHTDSSIGDGIGKPEDHFDYVLKNGGDSMAVSDHGNCGSFGYIFQAAEKYRKKGIQFKPIYGIEAYIHPDLDEWAKTKAAKDEPVPDNDLVVEVESESKGKYYDPIRRRHHLVLLAQNNEGLVNLNRLVTESYRHGFYRFPRMDFKSLEKWNKGVIINTACIHPDAELETSVGRLRMEEVVNRVKNGELMYVLGMDENTGQNSYHRVVWADKTRENARLLKIKLKDGKELKLTPDHKVFTDKGWVEAQNLTTNHKIMAL